MKNGILNTRKRLRLSLIASTVGVLCLEAAFAETKPLTNQPSPIPRNGSESAPRVDPRIVGGSAVPISSFRRNYRWMLSLQNAGGEHLCGATLIRSNLAMTAAHCVDSRPPSTLRLRHDSTSSSRGGAIYSIMGVISHPLFSRSTYDRDIALLRLSAPITGSPTIRPATTEITSAEASPGRDALALGWGALRESGRISDTLRSVTVPIVSLSICRRNYTGLALITANMICAGLATGGRDACQGDSGGPLAVRSRAGIWHQVGITSFGQGCGRPNRPGIYTRVAQFSSFIESTIGRRSESCIAPGLPAHFRIPQTFDCFSLNGLDDDSSGLTQMGFTLRMGSQRFSGVFVNVNGNLSFGRPNNRWRPQSLTSFQGPIIAPFWADANTRAHGDIRYGRARLGNRDAFMVIWRDVPGFYSDTTLRNTFQVVITRTSNSAFEIEFNYATVQWSESGVERPVGAYVGFSLGQSVRGSRGFRQVRGSGLVANFVDGARMALRSASNVGVPGRFVWRIRDGLVSY